MLQGEREMASDNKSLGRFHLDGIPAARRGVPQIEVTFDIDANGIVNVSAKDLGTGKQQNITITASTNLSKSEIEKAVKEAEQFAGDDKKRKEEIETRNSAEQLVYQTEKTVEELGDKLSADEKSSIESAVSALKTALQGTDIEAVKSASEALTKKFYEISEKLYSAAGAASGTAGAQPGSAPEGDVVDADYEDVDDNK
ncbi:Chaperone protein DnaK [bioreactor metagenome]|uniref:Chaperone protein DnaK n=1 Tax=bioreactor metagenome TaxID=1076179 RepID=A0A645EYP5_9ZZZZ